MENETNGATRLFYIGIALTIISYCFMFSRAESGSRDLFNGNAFFINYGIAIVYLAVILIYNLIANVGPSGKLDFRLFAVFLILFTASGFSLNREIALFSEFTTALKLYIVLMHVTLLGLCFISKKPAVV